MNLVATMWLNGEIDSERAKLYTSNARNIVAAVSAQVTRDRFLRQAPDLDFDQYDLVDDDAEEG